MDNDEMEDGEDDHEEMMDDFGALHE